jgi:hypothetical protein
MVKVGIMLLNKLFQKEKNNEKLIIKNIIYKFSFSLIIIILFNILELLDYLSYAILS